MDAFLRTHLAGGEEAQQSRCALGVRWKCGELTKCMRTSQPTREHLDACVVLSDALHAYKVVGVDLPEIELLAKDVLRTEERAARKRVAAEEEAGGARKRARKK